MEVPGTVLDLRRLTTLEAVVRTGSFANAAAELGYTQSAVSQQIAELERAAGVQLVTRRPVRPTNAGAIALRAATVAGRALEAASTELRALREGRLGVLRLGAFASAGPALAVPAIARFAATHPDVAVTLVQVEPGEARRALVSGELDLAITFTYGEPAPREPDDPLAWVALLDDPLRVALPSGHPLAARGALALDELASEPWIASPLAGFPLETLRAAGGAFAAGSRFVGDDFATVLALVAHGRGLALLPELALRAVPDGVAVRPLEDAALRRTLHLARLRGRQPSPWLEHALQEVASEIGSPTRTTPGASQEP